MSAEVSTRKVNEGASGLNVGAPVRGTDADDDVLNYALTAREVDNDNDDFDDRPERRARLPRATALDYEDTMGSSAFRNHPDLDTDDDPQLDGDEDVRD